MIMEQTVFGYFVIGTVGIAHKEESGVITQASHHLGHLGHPNAQPPNERVQIGPFEAEDAEFYAASRMMMIELGIHQS